MSWIGNHRNRTRSLPGTLVGSLPQDCQGVLVMLGAGFFRQANEAVRRHQRSSGKFSKSSKPTAAKDLHQEYRGWQIDVTEKKVGVTVSRRTYSASMWRKRNNVREFFAGFATQQAALQAVHERINEMTPPSSATPERGKVCGRLIKKTSGQERR